MHAASPPLVLTSNIAAVAGVGARRAEAFRRLGIRSVADLVRHLPLRYERELEESSIGRAEGSVGAAADAGATVTVRGEIAATRVARGRRSRFEATLEDPSGTILLTWFNAPWMHGRLPPGSLVRATGKLKRYGDALQMVNPRWEALDPDDENAPRDARLRPVYPATEDLTTMAIETAVAGVLDAALPLIDDHLHPDYRRERSLPLLADAYRMIHRPADEDEVGVARRRLAFDELLMLQLGVMLKRRHRRDTQVAPALRADAAVDQRIRARLPFALTRSQRNVIDEIIGDVTATSPMNRLLQGDVGAGKTVVALYAMLLAVASGHQAALMAPTELLAEQHFGTMGALLDGSDVSIELLTGSLAPARRDALRERLAAGEVDLLVGTHALLTAGVAFRSLALAVVDEQHRFGVHQRATLRTKGGGADDDAAAATSVPHVLVMTATPIPRTMSLTVFGDLDISTIDELPPGRRVVETRHVPGTQSDRVYGEVAERLAAGEQAFVVVPVIDESEAGLTDVNTHLEHLQTGPLRARRLAAMHGRLRREERDAIMERFRRGDLDAIVATTVIEVGVDVPGATIMVIEHADRFGLAQLHQLRGRVGRGERASRCVLIADPTTDEATERLAAIVATNDGFRIAERDLEIRGPGELFGSRQSGLPPFHAAELPRDLELLRLARRDAVQWVVENPTLAGERDALLRKRLLKAHGKALGLGDVG